MPKIYFGAHSLARFEPGTVLTIGAFDGVHLGHQSIITALRKKSAELGLPVVAVTFHPDPARYFQREDAPAQIMSWREKALALLEAGVDAVVCLQFNAAIRHMSADEFVTEILSAKLGAKHVIVGSDFRFGVGREGDFDRLTELGSLLGFGVERAQTLEHDGVRISSTRLRKLLMRGDFEAVEALLGRPYEICGRVVLGHQLGRTLGFPTANVLLKRDPVALTGVFAIRIKIDDSWYRGAANIGYRPAVNTLKKPLLEVHVLDFDGDIYGQRIQVRFEKKIRDEQHFDGLDDLKNAITEDIRDVRAWFVQSMP